jgi:hypothetical protein
MTRPPIPVEVSLDLTPKVAVEGFLATQQSSGRLPSTTWTCLNRSARSASNRRSTPSGERIRQAESDEVVRTLAFDVRKITAKCGAAAQWVSVRLPDTRGAEFVSHSLKTRLSVFR